MESSAVNAVGVWFYCINTDRYLYLLRNDKKNPGSWALPGGKIESNESLLAAIDRECREEMGFMPNFISLIPVEKYTAMDNHFEYNTFIACVDQEFCPVLNDEHLGYAWVRSSDVPKPLHPGLYAMIKVASIQEKLQQVKQRFAYRIL